MYVHDCMCVCVSDELVDWDPWQPSAAAVMDDGDDSGPHCDDPDFNVSQHTLLSRVTLQKIAINVHVDGCRLPSRNG